MFSWLEKKLPFLTLVQRHRVPYLKGIGMLIFVDFLNVVFPLLVKYAIDALTLKKLSEVYWMAGSYFVLMALQSWGRYWWRIYLMGTSHQIAKELREGLFDHLQKLPLPYYQRVRTGDLMSRATNDVEAVRMAIGPGILVAADAIILFLFIVPVMFSLSVKLSLMAFAFYPLVPWITKVLGGKIDTLFGSIQLKLSELSGFTQEAFSAIRLIKSFVLENQTSKRFRVLSQDLSSEGLRLAKYEAVFSPLLSFLTQLGTLLILIVGGMDVISGLITVGTFVAFQRFVVQLSWPMEAIGWSVTLNREGNAAYRRLEEVLQTETRVESYGESAVDIDSKSLLEIPHLDFSFQGEGGFRLALQSLEMRPGAKIGIVGPVGSGKSTLLNLILRLYEPKPGSIYFKGRDVLNTPLSVLRTEIASVEQQVFLFSETIRANALLGVEDQPFTEEDLRHLSRVADIDREIIELDRAFETILGEKGVNLSGGQKQRVAFLRALSRKPNLLLLDDCFSAVDVEVENRIIKRFFDEYKNLSVIFVSHRLSAMTKMDELWLLDKGQLVEKGTHEELLSNSTLYQSLWKLSESKIVEEKIQGTESTENIHL